MQRLCEQFKLINIIDSSSVQNSDDFLDFYAILDIVKSVYGAFTLPINAPLSSESWSHSSIIHGLYTFDTMQCVLGLALVAMATRRFTLMMP